MAYIKRGGRLFVADCRKSHIRIGEDEASYLFFGHPASDFVYVNPFHLA
jgi:hypothetical protein